MGLLALLLAVGMGGGLGAEALKREVATTSQKLINPFQLITAAKKKPGPKLELTIDPRIGLMMPYSGPLLVRVRVHVIDPVQDLYCPEITWQWGDETKSVHQEDCDFFQPGQVPNDTWYSNHHYYREWGQFIVKVILKAATATRSETSSLEIR